jgi:hypothetical protein
LIVNCKSALLSYFQERRVTFSYYTTDWLAKSMYGTGSEAFTVSVASLVTLAADDICNIASLASVASLVTGFVGES